MLTLGIARGCFSRGKGQVVKVSEVMVRKCKKGLLGAVFRASDPRAHPQHEDQGSLYHALNHVLEHRVAVGPLHGPFPCQLLPEQGGRREPGGKIEPC